MNCVKEYFESSFLYEERPGIVEFQGDLYSLKNSVSFKQFTISLFQVQNSLLALGIQKGDYALIFEPPGPNLFVIITACMALGIKILLVEPWLPVHEIHHIIQMTKPKLFIRSFAGMVFSLRHGALRSIPFKFSSTEFIKRSLEMSKGFTLKNELGYADVEDSHECILTFTSGTTGVSKGVARTHGFLIEQRKIIQKYLVYEQLDKLDLTVFTNFALVNLVMGKGSMVIPHWKRKILDGISLLPDEYLPDTLASGPRFLELLCQHTHNRRLKFSNVKVGGALTDIELAKNFLEKFQPKKFQHVYGSTEAEPVAFSSMEESIQKSQAQGSFQCTFLGRAISEIQFFEEKTLWVSGPHVSTFYLRDEVSNQKNKKLLNGNVFHNMGDRIKVDKISENESELWYQGRDFQIQEDFLLEQKIYHLFGHSRAYVHRGENFEKILVVEDTRKDLKKIIDSIDSDLIIKKVKKIFRDRRHLSRIDRQKTNQKFKI